VVATVRVEGVGAVVAALGRLRDAAAAGGGATLEVFSDLPYSEGIETGRTGRGRLARAAGGAHMFRRGAEEGLRGIDAAVAAALPRGEGAVTQAYLAAGRRVVDAVRDRTPVVSGRLRGSVRMRLTVGR
jgi:hypothetical protein